MSRFLAAALPILLVAAADCPDEAARPRCADGHTVAPHETLYRIARNCRSSIAAVAAASHVVDPRHIAVGQRLIIPGGAGASGKGDEDMGPPPPRGRAPLVYSFAPGDTLYSLARWARVPLPALLAANPGIDPRDIATGDVIRLPNGAVPPEAQRLRERGPARMMPVAVPLPPGPPPPPRMLPPAPPMHVMPPPRPLPPPDEGKKDGDRSETPGL
jgi:LysM repeat protein